MKWLIEEGRDFTKRQAGSSSVRFGAARGKKLCIYKGSGWSPSGVIWQRPSPLVPVGVKSPHCELGVSMLNKWSCGDVLWRALSSGQNYHMGKITSARGLPL